MLIVVYNGIILAVNKVYLYENSDFSRVTMRFKGEYA
jgi:hypothetical protein